MPRPPNYNQERKDRERVKAEKKAEKLAAKAAKKDQKPADDTEAEAEAGQ